MMNGMAGKASGRTQRAYMRGVFAGTEGGERAAQLWALVGRELHGGPEWLVTLRGGSWLALGGAEADYAREHPEALLSEIRDAVARDAGRVNIGVGVGVGLGPLLLLGLLALPVLMVIAGAALLILVAYGIARVIDYVKGSN